ncbi:MAG: outer membrane protein transport protein [Methylococcales bacterium]|nr:outer membrane protein transport protein [Methylococcales bacterium]
MEDGDDFSATISASVLWQVTDNFRLGLGYLGENELKFESDLSIRLPGIGSGTSRNNISIDVTITFPQVVALSGALEIDDHLTITARVDWEDWSALDSVPVSTNSAGASIPLNWNDVWSVGLGMRWKSGGPWTYYTGVSYDSDPTKASDRISILPVDRQWRFSGGVTYALNATQKVGGVITYIDLGEAAIKGNNNVGILKGDYSTNRTIFIGLNFGWQ